MTTPFRYHVTVRVPCVTEDAAGVIDRVLSVDRELRPHDIEKTLEVTREEDGTSTLLITMHATTLRHLRLSLNACLDNTALILRTLDVFSEDGSVRRDADVPAAQELERGSVGRVV
ncbi:low-specificity L-threonine aldolase [Malassezia sp. CBS 17886]|nr:low-specificity L-threonine aldolase [Malassezia sp. CBS 17886]